MVARARGLLYGPLRTMPHTLRTSHSHRHIHATAYHTDGTPRRPVTHALAVAWFVPQLCKRTGRYMDMRALQALHAHTGCIKRGGVRRGQLKPKIAHVHRKQNQSFNYMYNVMTQGEGRQRGSSTHRVIFSVSVAASALASALALASASSSASAS